MAKLQKAKPKEIYKIGLEMFAENNVSIDSLEQTLQKSGFSGITILKTPLIVK